MDIQLLIKGSERDTGIQPEYPKPCKRVKALELSTFMLTTYIIDIHTVALGQRFDVLFCHSIGKINYDVYICLKRIM